MGSFGALGRVLSRVVGATGHDVPRGTSGAAPRVGHETTQVLSLTLQACSEASPRRPPVPTTGVDEKVPPVTVVVHGAPQLLALPVDRDAACVQTPRSSESTVPSLHPPGVLGADLPAPLPKSVVRHDAAAVGQQILAGSRVDRAGWATSGPWTRASSPSRTSGALSGVPSIKRVTSSIAASRRVASARLPNTFCKLLQGQERQPGRLVTDRAAHRAVLPSVAQGTDRYAHHRADVSHQPTRHRARHLRRVNSPGQAQRFLSVHGLVRTLFHVGRHLVRAVHHRKRRRRSFLIGDAVTLAA